MAEVIPIYQRTREFRSYQAGWLESASVLVETVAADFKGEADPLSASTHVDLVTAQNLLNKVAERLSPALRAPD